jgi:Xaa-Pro dipeptidase
MSKSVLSELKEAERKADFLFKKIEEKALIKSGISEKQLNIEIYNLADELFGIKKYWHKRIVRSGKNTLCPYQDNPPDLVIQKEDIVFLDFGPVFEDWEADFGRTYIVGNNPKMFQLKEDVERAWEEGKNYFLNNKNSLIGSDFYHYTRELAIKYGWEYGNHHCGHLIGNFPHEIIQGEELRNYIHPENTDLMILSDKNGMERHWIYEIHFVDRNLEIGGFFEQLLF